MIHRVRIPPNLQNNDFRFVKILGGEKFPFEKSWQEKNNYAWNDSELQEHLDGGGNYGVVCGYGGLVVIDADKREVGGAVREVLPETFTVRTGGGGSHFYYFCKDLDKPMRLREKKTGDLGDVQFTGKQVVGANSIHPNGKKYEVEKNLPIREVSAEEIRLALRDFLLDESEDVVGEEREALEKSGIKNKIPLTSIAPVNNLKRVGGEFQGSHPVHGSTTGRNFCVNPRKGVWHCFRHGTGGGSLSWLAVQEGIIKCSEAVPGALRGRKFKRVLKKARELGLIAEEDIKRWEEPEEIKLSDLRAELINHPIRVQGQIVGEDSGKAIPRVVQASCSKCGASYSVELSLRKSAKLLEIYLFKGEKRVRDYLRSVFTSKAGDCNSEDKRHEIQVRFSDYSDYSFLLVRDLMENIRGDQRAYKPREFHLVGQRPPESKKVEIEGRVIQHPRSKDIVILADRVEPLKTELENFVITREDEEAFIKYFSEQGEIHKEIAPNIVGEARELPKRWFALTLFSPPEIPNIHGRRIRGCLLIAFFGDTTAGKSETAKDLTDDGEFPYPLGSREVVETGSRTGLLYTIDTDRRALIWGSMVLHDLGFLVLDGLNNLEELPEFREVLRTGKVSVRKTVSGDAWARPRIVACFNPDSPMAEQLFACKGIMDTRAFSRTPEVTRWDAFIPFNLRDVPPETISKRDPEERPIPPEIFHRHVLWAWSRKPDDIEYTNEAKEEIKERTSELVEKYSCESLPIVSNESFDTICRVSVAEASMKHSTNANHEKVIVEKKHVKEAIRDYEEVLEKLELELYKESEKERTTITETNFSDINADLDRNDYQILGLVGNKPHSSSDLAEKLDIGERAIKTHYKRLKKHDLIETKPGARAKLSPKGIRFLRLYREAGEQGLKTELSQEELLRGVREVWDKVGGGTLEEERFLDILQVKFGNENRNRLGEIVRDMKNHPENPIHFIPKVERLEASE